MIAGGLGPPSTQSTITTASHRQHALTQRLTRHLPGTRLTPRVSQHSEPSDGRQEQEPYADSPHAPSLLDISEHPIQHTSSSRLSSPTGVLVALSPSAHPNFNCNKAYPHSTLHHSAPRSNHPIQSTPQPATLRQRACTPTQPTGRLRTTRRSADTPRTYPPSYLWMGPRAKRHSHSSPGSRSSQE